MEALKKITQDKNTPFALRVTYSVVKIREDVSARKVAAILKKYKIGALIVERKGKLCGIISERDIVWKVVAKGKTPDEVKARDIMTRKVITVDVNEGIDKVYETMKRIPFRHLPITKENKVIGIVSSRDLMYLRRLKTVRK